MCLGVPGKVLAIDGLTATVDFFGVRRDLRLDIVDEPVRVGDYVLNHVGFAIRRIPPEEVQETLALFDAILRHESPSPPHPSPMKRDGGRGEGVGLGEEDP
jgi:hydrogenase expression/formation protein HypC